MKKLFIFTACVALCLSSVSSSAGPFDFRAFAREAYESISNRSARFIDQHCGGYLSSSVQDPETAALGLPPRLTGLPTRGLLGTYGRRKGAAFEAAAAGLGISWWYSKVFVVGSMEEAIRQERLSEVAADLGKDPDKRHRSAHMRGFYSIQPGVTLGPDTPAAEARRIFRNVLKQPVYYFQHASDPQDWVDYSDVPDANEVFTPVQLDPKLVQQRFDPKFAVLQEHFVGEGWHYRLWGWHFPNPYGIIRLGSIKSSVSSTFKKIEQRAQALAYPEELPGRIPAKTRLVVTFNRDLEAVMRAAAKQHRNGQSVESNRIDEKMIQDFLKMQDAGQTVSVEVWFETQNPQTGELTRVLKAGLFGTVIDGVYEINSEFHPNELVKKTRPNGEEYEERVSDTLLARIATIALRDRMIAAYGEDAIIVALTVTGFSKTIKARFYSAAEALPMVDLQRNNTRQPDYVTEWAPTASEKVRSRPFGDPKFGPVPDLRIPYPVQATEAN